MPPDVSKATCHSAQVQPDGTCCPAGQFYEHTSDACLQVGPPECAEVAFTSPEACVPRWCWSGKDDAGGVCDPVMDSDCPMVGRLCSADELAAGAGCDAGMAPDRHKPGECVSAGYFPGSGVPRDWNGSLDTLPPVPPIGESHANAPPPLVSLPPADDTFFCIDEATGQERFCTEAEMQVCARGPKGELPDPKKCVYVGVPWPGVCPPGFVVDGAAKVAQGQLAPCKPDPADCGTDEYGDAELKDGEGVLFVNGAAGSDDNPGTRKAPLKTIGKGLALAGLAAVPEGGTVAVAQGVYEAPPVMSKAVALRGRCAAMVLVEGKAKQQALAVSGDKQSGELFVSGLRLGGEGAGLGIWGGPKVRIERVMVAEVSRVGIQVTGDGAVLAAQSVVVAGTLPRASDKKNGHGMYVGSGAQLSLQDVRLSTNRTGGLVVAKAGTVVAATGLLVDGTLPRQSDKGYGRGVEVYGGARLTLKGARVSANRNLGLFVGGAGTVVEATRLLVDGTLPRELDKGYGWGVNVGSGAEVKLKDARLSANRGYGLYVTQEGTRLHATRLLVDGTLPRASDSGNGLGVSVRKAARATLQDARLSANRQVGLEVATAGTSLDATRILVDGTLPQASDNESGRAVSVELGAQLTLQDTRLSANREVGLAVLNAGTRVVATRLVVDGTLGQESDGMLGRGVSVQFGPRVTLQDARLSANRDIGLFVGGAGSELDATRLVIDGTLPRKIDKRA